MLLTCSYLSVSLVARFQQSQYKAGRETHVGCFSHSIAVPHLPHDTQNVIGKQTNILAGEPSPGGRTAKFWVKMEEKRNKGWVKRKREKGVWNRERVHPGTKVRKERRIAESKNPRRHPWAKSISKHSGESHGQRSLAGHSPWDRKELDITKYARIMPNLSLPMTSNHHRSYSFANWNSNSKCFW